jgi:hypothetical protein
MLGEAGCSIYAHRPRACRVYDCRVFVATGVEIDEPAKAAVDRRVRRWRFSYESPDAERLHNATRSAAAYLESHQAELPGDPPRPLGATRRAVLAVELAELFTTRNSATGDSIVVEPAPGDVAALVNRKGDAGRTHG